MTHVPEWRIGRAQKGANTHKDWRREFGGCRCQGSGEGWPRSLFLGSVEETTTPWRWKRSSCIKIHIILRFHTHRRHMIYRRNQMHSRARGLPDSVFRYMVAPGRQETTAIQSAKVQITLSRSSGPRWAIIRDTDTRTPAEVALPPKIRVSPVFSSRSCSGSVPEMLHVVIVSIT
mmetsp:Transcript_2385/g.6595  ORF Transcript_2385/g.6595 Transcript_2385/m.6595 type:complete len:175 (-) Transcript_2385:1879-2403(-)